MHELHGSDATTLGNQPAVRTWMGDVESVPAFQGPFDAAFFNAVFGNVFDQHEALLRTCLLLRPGCLPCLTPQQLPGTCSVLSTSLWAPSSSAAVLCPSLAGAIERVNLCLTSR